MGRKTGKSTTLWCCDPAAGENRRDQVSPRKCRWRADIARELRSLRIHVRANARVIGTA